MKKTSNSSKSRAKGADASKAASPDKAGKSAAKAKASEKKPAAKASKSEVKEPARKAAKAAEKAKVPARAEKPKATAKPEKAKAEKAKAEKAKPEKPEVTGKAKAAAEAAEAPAPRKRGRPRKDAEAEAAAEPAKGRRGRKPKQAAEEEAAPTKSRDDEFQPDLEEEPDLDEDFDISDREPAPEPEAEPAAPKRKARKTTRKRRSRQLPRVPDTLRAFPAWAEAWTALAEAGIEAHLIPAVLRDASLVFNGLNELTHKSVEALFHFWEVAETPAGIESILEEAFLSQAPQPERKQQLEAFFREVMSAGDVNDALAVLWTARHVPDWRHASRSLKATGSPFAENVQLFALARDIVG